MMNTTTRKNPSLPFRRLIASWSLAAGLAATATAAPEAQEPAPPSAAAPVAAAAATPEQAVAAAREKLDATVRELTAQREKIGSEKVPMAQELNTLQEQLAARRRDYDKQRRAVDMRTLELNNLRNDTKAHQDEIAYLGNLLDEYARGFEGRIHPSEVQRYSATMETALLAPQNKDLSPTQKLEHQMQLVKASMGRLRGLVGGARFDGTAVDPQGMVDKGKFALIGPVALFAADNGKVAGLALAQPGSNNPVVRPLEASLMPGLATIVTAGSGILPLDPTRGDALKALIAKGSLWGYFKKGGPIMWPLLVLSLLAFSVILERIAFLTLESRRRKPATVAAMMTAAAAGDIAGAAAAGAGSQDCVARCLTYALQQGRESLPNALMRAAAQEVQRYNRGISFLDTVVTMAPLLGLLGTVTGMIGAFGMLGGAELSAPAAITGGIAEALIATTFGLGIAIVTLIPLNYLHSCCEDVRHQLEDASTHLELLLKSQAEVARLLTSRADHPAAPAGYPGTKEIDS